MKGVRGGQAEAGLRMCNQVQRIVAGSVEQIARKSCDTDDITCYT